MTATEVQGKLRDLLDLDSLRGLFPGAIADEIRRVIAGLLDQLDLSNLTPEQKQAILAAIKGFYDSVVRPFDIPYIPNVVEGMVDDWIWLAAESLVKRKLGLI